MALIQFKNVSLSFGDNPLLDEVNLIINARERIALVGRNGSGKSTLLKLINHTVQPDGGEIVFADGLIVRKLQQEIPDDLTGDVQCVVAQGSKCCGNLLAQYYQLTKKNSEIPSSLQAELNNADAWAVDQQVKTLISKFQLNAGVGFTELSGGLKRRVLLAQSLVDEPNLLLLDEPTNHLDIATIEWMEKMLLSLNTTLLLVSHDRAFINQLATRILDLDRGCLTNWPGNFEQYFSGKEKALADETNQQKAFDKKLTQEEAWIRKGIQARRTRNEGRVRALKKLRRERAQRRSIESSSNFNLNQATQSGQLVVEALDVKHGYSNDNVIIKNFSTTVLRGDKIGIIGPNGCGKSTLVKLLTGELLPNEGTIRLGTRLQIAYLDQQRSLIQENQSLVDNIAEGRSEVVINDKSVHIMSYIQDFLFSPQRAQIPASALSGGERNRLILAKLFTKPFNLLILDEPTNDLDIDTLELLEQKLVDYKGSLILISHDRTFLNNIVTSTLAFEGKAKVNEYIGGYDDWLRQREFTKAQTKPLIKKTKVSTESNRPKKLTYKERQELKSLPDQIEKFELELESLQTELADPTFYQQDAKIISKANEKLKIIELKLDQAYSRWEQLENS